METKVVDREHLESLSFADLVSLADEYDIDVPEDLDRQFLILELLEVLEESENDSVEDMSISSDSIESEMSLPGNYNETQISAVLRNPAWAFVFWNISDSDKSMLKKNGLQLMLRICSLENKDDDKPKSTFEIQTLSSSQEQYVLLPNDSRFVRIELAYTDSSAGNILAASSVIEIPQGADFLNDLKPGKIPDVSEIVKLSGLGDLLMQQYTNHRS